MPQLVRFTVAQGADGLETTLLIKATNLSLKYLVRRKRLRFFLLRAGDDWLGYGIEVPDDPDHPGLIWSIMERDDERAALEALARDPKCVAFLFNEALANVAWADLQLDLSGADAKHLIETSTFAPSDDRAMAAMQKVFAEMDANHSPSTGQFMRELPPVAEWHPIQSTYITNRAAQSSLSIFDKDEGAQQEEVALWLIDNLRPEGAIKNPQIHEPKKPRELSDLLLSYEYGTFLVESKTLSVMTRDSLPPRPKLARDLIKRLDKAVNQLVGGLKNIQRGYRVTDLAGADVEVNRTHLPHVIVLVPDLSLLASETAYGGSFFARIMERAGAFFHILDPAELLRMVQAAGMIAEDSTKLTTMMAFDCYLMERAKLATQRATPYFGMLYRKPGQITVVEHE